MHELALSKSIMHTLDSIRQEQGNKRIKKVTINLGALQHVVPDSLKFYLDLLKEKTPFEESEFQLKETPIKIKCQSCGHVTEIPEMIMICDSCQSRNVEVIEGMDVFIESVEI
ncbi:MAG: hydrogenase maturation nickel metallochaperone HypA [Spirochaetes bacterium]|nr:hydrogenase maturation nickel metallochaperone HypA [Spirochaetota bacterium]